MQNLTQKQEKILKKMEAQAFFVAETENNPLIRRAKIATLRKPLEKVPEDHVNYPVAARFLEYLNHLEAI